MEKLPTVLWPSGGKTPNGPVARLGMLTGGKLAMTGGKLTMETGPRPGAPGKPEGRGFWANPAK